MNKREYQYQVNSLKASFELFNKLFIWVKNSNLSYRVTESFDLSLDCVTFDLYVDDVSLVTYMEEISAYNERLEQRLIKL